MYLWLHGASFFSILIQSPPGLAKVPLQYGNAAFLNVPHPTPCTCWVETQFLLPCYWKPPWIPSVPGDALLSLLGSFLDCAKSYLVLVPPPTPNWCFVLFFSWSKIVYALLFLTSCLKGKQHSEIVFEMNTGMHCFGGWWWLPRTLSSQLISETQPSPRAYQGFKYYFWRIPAFLGLTIHMSFPTELKPMEFWNQTNNRFQT